MNVAVCVRLVVDPEARVQLGPGGDLDAGSAPRLMDPVDAAALELAVQVAAGQGGRVTAFTATDGDAEEVLRGALAQGADEAVQVTGVDATSAASATAGLAAALAQRGPFDLVVTGWSSSDFGTGCTAARLAQALDAPIVQAAASVPSVADGAATLDRRRDGGYREGVRVRLPAVISVYPGAVAPRFPTTQARLRARRAEIATHAADAAVDADLDGTDLRFRMPPPRMAGILVPPTEMSAADRLRFLVAGGQHRGGSSRVVSGSPDEAADALAAFLRERDLVVGGN